MKVLDTGNTMLIPVPLPGQYLHPDDTRPYPRLRHAKEKSQYKQVMLQYLRDAELDSSFWLG
jgi:hypothetical protein